MKRTKINGTFYTINDIVSIKKISDYNIQIQTKDFICIENYTGTKELIKDFKRIKSFLDKRYKENLIAEQYITR